MKSFHPRLADMERGGAREIWGEQEKHEESVMAAQSRGGERTFSLDSGPGSLQCYGPFLPPSISLYLRSLLIVLHVHTQIPLFSSLSVYTCHANKPGHIKNNEQRKHTFQTQALNPHKQRRISHHYDLPNS